MKTLPLTARICLCISAIITLVGTVCQTIAMLTQFDSVVGYFNPSPLVTVCSVLFFVAVILPAVCAVITPKGKLPTAWPTVGRNVVAFLPAFVFGGIGLLMMYTASVTGPNTLSALVGLLALASLPYFVLTVAQTSQSRPSLVSALGFLPIVWSLLSVAETYIDQCTAMNSPIKLSLQFGFLGVALAISSELRFRLDKAAPRAALYFHCIGMYACFTGSIPLLARAIASNDQNAMHTCYAVILLAVGVYVAFRLCTYVLCPLPAADADEGESASANDSESSVPTNADDGE